MNRVDLEDFSHFHYSVLDSTQTKLKDLLGTIDLTQKNLLVSTDVQSSGVGRHGNPWHSRPGHLLFSCTIEANTNARTLTPLELGLSATKFFKKVHDVSILLKWPNDLIFQGNKAGGIICHSTPTGPIIAGLGINTEEKFRSFSPDGPKSYTAHSVPVPEVLNGLKKIELIRLLYQFILDNRIPKKIVLEQWQETCEHLNKEVIIFNDKHKTIGKFRGIGQNGEALIEEKHRKELKKIYSGTLRANPC